MAKRIFKAGNYGTKGNYTKEDLKSWVGQEFNITAGHVGDWKKQGYPVTAIPVAGTCKATSVDEEGYLLGEFNLNGFGNDIAPKYPNLSIGLSNGGIDHLAMLGYAPPHIDGLSKSYSEFSTDVSALENSILIEFEEGLKGQDLINELANQIKGIEVTNDLDFSILSNALWDKKDEKYFIEQLISKGYTIEKTAEFSKETFNKIADILNMAVTPKEAKVKTEQEIREEIKAEFAREGEKKETLEKLKGMFPPVLFNVIEFATEQAFNEKEYSNIIEFSSDDKGTMANKLKEFSKEDGPFKHLFENYAKEGAEFNNQGTKEETAEETYKRIKNI